MLLPGGITNIFAVSGVLEGLDVKKIKKGVDGLSISQYMVLFYRSACLHFHEFLFLGLFNAI
jgi:hypothetical protein